MTDRSNHDSQRKTLLFSLAGVLLGLISLCIIGGLVFHHYGQSFAAWERHHLYWLAIRLRATAQRRRIREEMRAAPEQPKGELNERLRVYEQRGAATQPSAKAGTEAAADSFDVKLRKLHDLKSAGILSEEEFETKKSEILKKID